MEYVYNTTAEAAKAIKAELKAKFPGIKFSVKSHNYSMGCAIRVSWDFGPTQKAVEMVTDKYQYGRFNSMDDSSSVEHTLVSMPNGEIKALGGADHVFANRGYGDNENEFFEKVQKEICALQGIEYDGPRTNVFGRNEWDFHQTVNAYAGKTISKMDLTDGYKGVTSKLVFSNSY